MTRPTRFVWSVCITLLFGGLVSLAHPAAAKPDWPLPYQNANLTRVVTGTSNMNTATIRWRKRLGGANVPAMTQDINGDGLKELISLEGGRALCRNPISGAVLWSSPGLSLGFFMNDPSGNARDLNNDGVVDILVSKGHLGDTRIYALNGNDGQVQWSFGKGLGPNSGTNGINRHWLGNVDSDPATEVLLYVPSNANGATIFALDFTEGFASEAIQWTAVGMTYGGANQFSVADVTGNGQLNVIMSAAKDLHILNAANGAELAKNSDWYGEHPVIPYGIRLQPTNVDEDPAMELAGIYGGAQSFWGVWSINKDGTSQMLWKQATTGPVRLPAPIDLDGNGLSEIAVSLFTTTWTTTIHNGQSGAASATIPGFALTGLVTDLNGDKTRELIAQSANQQTIDPLADLYPLVWDGLAELSPGWAGGLSDASAAAVLDRDQNGADELLVYRDTNSDGKRDALQIVAQSGQSTKVVASYSFPKGNELTYKFFDDNINPPGLSQLVVFSADGYLDLLSAKLAPLGPRYATGGFNSAILVGALDESSESFAYVKDSLGHVLQIKVADGSVTDAPPHTVLFGGATHAQLLGLFDLDGDNSREILVHQESNGGHTYTLYESDLLTARWQYTPQNASAGPETDTVGSGGDLNGDGVEDLYLMTTLSGVRTGIPLSGATGVPLAWSWVPFQGGGGKGTAYSPALIHNFSGQETADVLVSRFHDRLLGNASLPENTDYAPIHLFNGSSGDTLHTLPSPLSPARMMRADLDGNSATEDLLITWWTGRGAFTINKEQGGAMKMLWYTLSSGPITKAMPMALDLDGDGLDDLLHFDGAVGRIRAERGVDGTPLWAGETGVVAGVRQLANGKVYKLLIDGGHLDAASGEAVADPGTTNLSFRAVAVSDLSGDGHPNALFAGQNGQLYCINLSDGTLDWSFDFGFSIGHIVVADIDNDSMLEVLATVDDGYLYVLGRQAELGQISQVRDGLEDDEDEILEPGKGFELDTFSANWDAPDAGAEAVEGYLLRLITKEGALVVDWQDVGNQTQVTIQGYTTLAPGSFYRVVVMPYGKSGTGTATLSNGFWLAENFVPPDKPDEEDPPVAVHTGTVKQTLSGKLIKRQTEGCSAVTAPLRFSALGRFILLLLLGLTLLRLRCPGTTDL